jgi:crossover junction endodeoxyribonuclease RusA
MPIVKLAYPPSVNRIWRTAHGRTYKPAKVSAWMAASAVEARIAGVAMHIGDVHVSVILHPKLTKKGKANENRIDLDNAIKAVLDALQGVAFDNDKQVVKLNAEVGYPVQHGGLTVEVSPA